MSFINSYDPYTRYRKRSMQRMAGVGVAGLFLLMVVAIGFFIGRQSVFRNEIVMQAQIKTLNEEKAGLEEKVTELKAETLTAVRRYDDLQKTYNEKIPAGPVQEVIKLVHEQIANGMDPERLLFLIRSSRPPKNCSEPETVRFVVSTPAYKGPESKAGIADGFITIKGEGVSAMNAKGQQEAWFDAGKSVTLQFLLKDGRSEVKKGILPIHQSLVVGEREYRFTVTEGARSFAKVTFDSCDYP